MSRWADVVRAGALTTVQDNGRPGYAHLGVSRSGALDAPAHRLANRLVGNAEGASVLETTVTGVALRIGPACHFAVTGAWAPVFLDGRPAGWGVAVAAPPGATVEVGTATRGIRCYVAVSGSFAVPAVLGSRSTDVLSGLGPPALADGDRLALGDPRGGPAGVDMAPYPPPPGPGEEIVLRARLGPRQDWISAGSLDRLRRSAYVVAPDSNRVALRLNGVALRRCVHGELASEGMVTGAVQVPPDGQPIVLLADHPTTGGYPVVAVVHREDLGLCAQARPGTAVRIDVRGR